MGVINTINKSGTETKKIESVNKKLLEDAEPFVIHDDDEACKSYFNKPADDHVIDADYEDIALELNKNKLEKKLNAIESKSTKLLETLKLSIKEAYIKFCEESNIDLQPLVIVKLEMDGRISNWTRNLHVKTDLTLEAIYYNDRLSNWEPLIENVMQHEDMYRPWILSLMFAIESGSILQPPDNNEGLKFIEFPVKDLDYSKANQIKQGDDEPDSKITTAHANISPGNLNETFEYHEMNKSETENLGNANYIRIESNDMLNLNVTPSAYKAIMYLAQITAGSDKSELVENKDKPQLKFLNFLGEPSTLIVASESTIKPQHAVGFKLCMSKEEADSSDIFYDSINSSYQNHKDTQENLHKLILESQLQQVSTLYDRKYKFTLIVDTFEKCQLSLKTDGSYLIQLRKKVETNEESNRRQAFDVIKYNMMFKVRTNFGRAKVLFSSPLQVENNTKIKLLILTDVTQQLKEKFNDLKELEFNDSRKYAVIFELYPSKVYYVPLYLAYNCKIYTAPQNLQYAPALIFDIRGYNLRNDTVSQINCKRLSAPDDTVDSFEQHENSLVETNDIQFIRQLSLNVKSFANSMPSMHANYKVMLYSPIKLCNVLPFQFRIDIDNEDSYSTVINSGESLYIHLQLSKLASFKVHVINYLNTSWMGKINWPKLFDLHNSPETRGDEKLEMTLAPTTEIFVSGKHLTIYINYTRPNEFTFYSPYWFVNKSGQPIQIKSMDSPRIFNIPDEMILLFDFKHAASNKNKVVMNVKEGKWSKPFSIDAAGTTSMIPCRDNTFLMRVTMSNSSRSKLVTFAPFLLIVNQLDEPISIAECNRKVNMLDQRVDIWKKLQPQQSSPFWPNYAYDNKNLCFRLRTVENVVTEPFTLENPSRFVLLTKTTNMLDNKIKKLTVLISGGNQNPVTMIIRNYQYGDSVAKFVNLCKDLVIYIKEKEVHSLNPIQSMFFVWRDLQTKSNRDISFSVAAKSNSELTVKTPEIPLNWYLNKSGKSEHTFEVDCSDLKRDGSNETEINEDSQYLIRTSVTNKKRIKVFCVSYIDGTQRVILFTTDQSLAEIERRKEAASMEIFLSLKGMEISVINNLNLELATITISDSLSTWFLGIIFCHILILIKKIFASLR